MEKCSGREFPTNSIQYMILRVISWRHTLKCLLVTPYWAPTEEHSLKYRTDHHSSWILLKVLPSHSWLELDLNRHRSVAWVCNPNPWIFYQIAMLFSDYNSTKENFYLVPSPAQVLIWSPGDLSREWNMMEKVCLRNSGISVIFLRFGPVKLHAYITVNINVSSIGDWHLR